MAAADGSDGETRSTGSLFADLARQSAALVGDEVALARAELGEKFTQIRTGIYFVVAGWSLICVGLIMLMTALVLVLAAFFKPWLAAIIAGSTIVALGALLYLIGHRYLRAANLRPARTLRTLRGNFDQAL
jgi:hypothetical protein